MFESVDIDGLIVVNPRVFTDDRGYFYESFNEKVFKENGIDIAFQQDNQSMSKKGVIRGLHFQNPPFEQGKLVRVVKGAVLDIAVDIRKKSPTYGKHFAIHLSEENRKMLWIPPGFAHGFATLEDETLFMYKCTKLYDKESESGIIWNDPQLEINWEVSDPIISDKDAELQDFMSFRNLF